MSLIERDSLSTTEVKIYSINFAPSLIDGEELSSVTATHTPPSGNALTITPTLGQNNVVLCPVGPLAVEGVHLVDVHAVGDQGSEPEVRLQILVKW